MRLFCLEMLFAQSGDASIYSVKYLLSAQGCSDSWGFRKSKAKCLPPAGLHVPGCGGKIQGLEARTWVLVSALASLDGALSQPQSWGPGTLAGLSRGARAQVLSGSDPEEPVAQSELMPWDSCSARNFQQKSQPRNEKESNNLTP